MLTAAQIAHFETFGFFVLRQLFTPDEVAIMKEEAEEIFDEDRGGEPFEGIETQGVQPFMERKQFLSRLADDDRIYNIGVDLCGPDFVLEGTSGALRVGDTPWHADMCQENPLKNTQITFYPQPLTRDTGSLRVIPGSHHVASSDLRAVLGDERTYDGAFRPFGVAPSEIPCYVYESVPGDVLVHTESLIHGAFGGGMGRHQYSLSFIVNPKTEVQIASIIEVYKTAKFMLHPAESYVHSDRPRIRRMVSRLVELGFETSKV